MIKTLVTGATGFIGRHIVEALCKEDYKVRCLVRENSNIKRLADLGVEIFFGDLLDQDSLEKAVDGVNVIFHAAGEVYSIDPCDHDKINVQGTENLFKACINKPIEKLVYFSSIAATGPMSDSKTLLNEHTPQNPINAYGISKYKAEMKAQQFYNDHKVPIVILRLPVVYGPGVSESSRVFLFLHMIKKGLYRVIGNGENIISLCHIDNLINGVLLAAQQEKSIGKIYLIADERPYTINELVQSIAKEENVTLSKIHIPVSVAHIMAFIMMLLKQVFAFTPMLTNNLIKEATSNWGCNILLAQKDLNYQPPVDLQKGLKTTVNWYMQNY